MIRVWVLVLALLAMFLWGEKPAPTCLNGTEPILQADGGYRCEGRIGPRKGFGRSQAGRVKG